MSPRITLLPNGLRVVTENRPGLLSTAVGIWVDAGSRHETAQQNGISHMLEHMAFKGTERRSALQIAKEIEDVGGYLNAYTSREHTAYYARILKEDIGLAVDLIADILQNSVFEKDELERERGVIIQEIGQAQDTPDDIVFDYLQETAYPEQPLGRAILGGVDNVKRFGRPHLGGYMSAHYHGPRMVLAAAGAVDHDDILARAGKAFAALPPSAPRTVPAARYIGGDNRREKDLEQAHFVLAFEGVSYGHSDYFVSDVFVNALGGGMSSRLFQEVREKRGLAYAISAFANAYVDSGLIGVYAGTGEAELAELVPVVIGEIESLAANCRDDEVERAKAQLKAGLLMSLESSSARCEQLARQELIFGRPIPIEETIGRIDAIDVAAVKDFARTLMNKGAPSVAALGLISELEAPDKIAARFG